LILATIEINHLERWINPAYYPHRCDYSNRFEVYYGGAGSGKSHFVTQKLILKALNSPRKVLIVRKVGRTIKDSVFALFLQELQRFSMLIESVNKSDYTIKLKNGSELLFKGLDENEKIKSIVGIDDIWIEEATELTLDDFTQLCLRLRSKKPNNQVYLTFNPISKANWCYKYFFEHGTPKDTQLVQTTYKDNPHLPQEYIDNLNELQKTNPAYYKIYALGDFATLDRLIFPIIHKRIISPDETKGLLFWAGCDFGYTNDPTAINWGFVDNKNKKLYLTGEYDRVGMTNDIVAETITNLGLSKEIIICDSAEPKSIAELKKLGISRARAAVKGADSVMNGIDRLLRCSIIIDERCQKTIEEFENYTWVKDRKTGEYINEPIDSYNHHIDAIRYGTQLAMMKPAEEYKSPFGG
jgi:phage terminase large subunit